MANPQKFCIFCDGPHLTKTHIWPDWLNRLLAPPGQRHEHLDDPHDSSVRRSRTKQGSVFSQKPYLCCEACNTGWMKRFEDEMLKFSRPIFTSLDTITNLDHTQTRVLAVWISLITILAEFIDRKTSICIPKEDRIFVRKYLRPPDTWTILAMSSDAPSWYAKYRHHASRICNFSGAAEYHAAVASEFPDNTQISTFGMGHLLVQVFSCPNERYVQDYRAGAKSKGALQIWPIRRAFWPFVRCASTFPTKTVLTDYEAGLFADSFNKRIRILTQPPFFGGQSIGP